jgi:hypothetical protein
VCRCFTVDRQWKIIVFVVLMIVGLEIAVGLWSVIALSDILGREAFDRDLARGGGGSRSGSGSDDWFNVENDFDFGSGFARNSSLNGSVSSANDSYDLIFQPLGVVGAYVQRISEGLPQALLALCYETPQANSARLLLGLCAYSIS